MEGLPLNRALRDEDGDIYDIVAGDFLIVGLGEDTFSSLPDELITKYLDQFGTLEAFVRIGEKICVLSGEI